MITRIDLANAAYEQLVSMLRRLTLTQTEREIVQCELRCRDRALYNQWAQVCGGQFK